MSLFDWVLLGLFLFGFVGSCASLGATTVPAPKAEGEVP